MTGRILLEGGQGNLNWIWKNLELGKWGIWGEAETLFETKQDTWEKVAYLGNFSEFGTYGLQRTVARRIEWGWVGWLGKIFKNLVFPSKEFGFYLEGSERSLKEFTMENNVTKLAFWKCKLILHLQKKLIRAWSFWNKPVRNKSS